VGVDAVVQVVGLLDEVDGTTLYRCVDRGGELVAGPRVAVVGGMHGNEPAGEALLGFLGERLKAGLVAGEVVAVLANPHALELGERHSSGGKDLNRLWDRETLERLRTLPTEDLCYEEQRVLELAPMVMGCDVILDIHSTSRPTTPHLILRDDQHHMLVARQLGVTHLVTGIHENGAVQGGLCANVGLSHGQPGTRLGFVFETGQHMDPTNAERAWDVLVRLLVALDVWRTPPLPIDVNPEVFEITECVRQAPQGSPQYRFVGYAGGEAGEGRISSVKRTLQSFERVDADEMLLRQGEEEVVRARSPFTMLMPAPHAAPGADLFFVAQRRHAGLSSWVSKTDREALHEALAVERMLDLLSDDDFDAGASWVAFDSRRLLDVCAMMIGRCMRLPEGHPHRKLTIMSRGNVPFDDVERVAGQRYRQAIREAVVSGLPIERFQFMRGATLSWLDGLASMETRRLIQQRLDRGSTGALTFRVSTHQPPSLSMLVLGDPERALQDGDARWVRVAMVIEAATLHGDGAVARMGLERAGVFSAKPEILSTAVGLQETLRAQHRFLMEHGPLSNVPEVVAAMNDQHAIDLARHPEALPVLGRALRDMQQERWEGALSGLNLSPCEVSEDAIGARLTDVSRRTGILDLDSLRSLLVSDVGGGRVLWASPQSEKGVPLSEPGGMTTQVSPSPYRAQQPLFARDIDSDTLERWIGWTRFVQGVERIPGNRGRDLDLAFNTRQALGRLARWYREACEEGDARPGSVMVAVAGDGLHPVRKLEDESSELFHEHRAVVRNANVHYLRFQHAPTVHFGWMKGMLADAARRKEGPGDFHLKWEHEHGGSINVVLWARWTGGDERPVVSQLQGWHIERCAVLLSSMDEEGHHGYHVGILTEPGEGRVNAELLHFGRTHIETLIRQEEVSERGSAAKQSCALIEEWCKLLDQWHVREAAPDDPEERVGWVRDRVGVTDVDAAVALAEVVGVKAGVAGRAEKIWDGLSQWP
jgi:hypothetical protein